MLVRVLKPLYFDFRELWLNRTPPSSPSHWTQNIDVNLRCKRQFYVVCILPPEQFFPKNEELIRCFSVETRVITQTSARRGDSTQQHSSVTLLEQITTKTDRLYSRRKGRGRKCPRCRKVGFFFESWAQRCWQTRIVCLLWIWSCSLSNCSVLKTCLVELFVNLCLIHRIQLSIAICFERQLPSNRIAFDKFLWYVCPAFNSECDTWIPYTV